jgi:hypothetical protein
MNGWAWLWLLWGISGLALELPAVFNHQLGDTLSEQLKWILGIGRPLTWWIKLLRFIALAFWAWLPVHLAGFA